MRVRHQWLLPGILVTFVMVTVAAVQTVRVETRQQSAWVGAGFGMFATVDGHHRTVRFLDDTGASVEPPSRRLDVVALANDPTPERLRDALADVPGATRVEVLAPSFDPVSNRLSWRLLATERAP